MTETRNPHTRSSRVATLSQDNVDTDGSGDFTLTFTDLREIPSIDDVSVQAEGGYVANPQSVSGNTVTVRLYESAGSAAALAANTSGTDVTNVNARAEV